MYLPFLSQEAGLASSGKVKGGLRKDQPSQSSKIKSTGGRYSRSRSDRRMDKSDIQFKCYTHTPKMRTSSPASAASFQEKCRTVPSKLNNEVQSKMIKPKKTKRVIKSTINIIKTFNKFEILEIEKCNIAEMETKKDKSRHCRLLKQKKKKKDNVSNFKVNKKGWQKYETNNSFEVLKDNDEEDIKKILLKNRILKTSKNSLKKCKRCNFKKRSCIFNPSSCKSIGNCCIKCQKSGHYPQSQNCKAKKKVNKSKKSRIGIISKNVDHRKLCEDMLFLSEGK